MWKVEEYLAVLSLKPEKSGFGPQPHEYIRSNVKTNPKQESRVSWARCVLNVEDEHGQMASSNHAQMASSNHAQMASPRLFRGDGHLGSWQFSLERKHHVFLVSGYAWATQRVGRLALRLLGENPLGALEVPGKLHLKSPPVYSLLVLQALVLSGHWYERHVKRTTPKN